MPVPTGTSREVLERIVHAVSNAPEGFTINVVTLVIAYGLASLLTWRLFAAHEPSGDIAVPTLAVPDSRG